MTPKPLPPIQIDEPTIAMAFTINASPFAGREGQWVTSRNLRDRLDKELLTNVSIKVEELGHDTFKVMGRGELQLAILIEMMRREGYELGVGKPEIITKTVDGKVMEPVGYQIARVDLSTGVIEPFAVNRGKTNGPASKLHTGGLERPVAELGQQPRGQQPPEVAPAQQMAHGRRRRLLHMVTLRVGKPAPRSPPSRMPGASRTFPPHQLP